MRCLLSTRRWWMSARSTAGLLKSAGSVCSSCTCALLCAGCISRGVSQQCAMQQCDVMASSGQEGHQCMYGTTSSVRLHQCFAQPAVCWCRGGGAVCACRKGCTAPMEDSAVCACSSASAPMQQHACAVSSVVVQGGQCAPAGRAAQQLWHGLQCPHAAVRPSSSSVVVQQRQGWWWWCAGLSARVQQCKCSAPMHQHACAVSSVVVQESNDSMRHPAHEAGPATWSWAQGSATWR
jgi:hypothetical protein